jgi:hypothetical protein
MLPPNTRGAYFESLVSFICLQVIQNSAPSVVRHRQCDIRIGSKCKTQVSMDLEQVLN